jgi:hypothetical protein
MRCEGGVAPVFPGLESKPGGFIFMSWPSFNRRTIYSLADLDRLQVSALDTCNKDVVHWPVIALLPSRFCHHAIQEMLFGGW